MQPGVANQPDYGREIITVFTATTNNNTNKKCSSANEGSTQSILYSEVYDY